MAQTLGPYTLGQPLGTLPFGDLIEASHAARREPLALLILPEDLARDQRLRGLLRLEIARAGGLRHPAIARPIEVAEHDGRLYVVYERPPGEPLSHWIDDRQERTTASDVSLVRSLADGLDAAHGRRLAHGSIRPSAILVRPDQGLVLIGVGVLVAIDDAGLADACRYNLNPPYAAPEQRSGKLAVASADGYALGALARTLLAATADGTSEQVPPGAQTALERQASPEPSARFRTCAEFSAALSASLAPPSTSPPMPSTADRPPVSPPISIPTPAIGSAPPRREPYLAPTLQAHHSASTDVVAAHAEHPSTPPSQAPPRVRQPAPGAWRQDGRSRVRELPLTPAMREAIHATASKALQHATLVGAGPLILVVLILLLRDALLVLPAIALIVVLSVPQAIQRVTRLRTAQSSPEIVQALGPVRVVEQHLIDVLPYPRSHRLDVGDVDTLTISGTAFTAISAIGTHMHVEFDEEGKIPPHDAVYDLTALATYSRTGDLLLELRRPSGELIYLEPAYVGTDADDDLSAEA